MSYPMAKGGGGTPPPQMDDQKDPLIPGGPTARLIDRCKDGRDCKKAREEVKIEIKEEIGEPIKSIPGHIYRSDSEATNSQRGSSPSPERQTMAVRLLAISSSCGEPRGKWLREKMEDHFSKNGIDEFAPPTDEEIKMQLKLPSEEAIQRNEFKEPLTNWEPVEGTGIPGWIKELLPEEEIVRPPDWRPPTPPRVDIGLLQYVDEFKINEEPELPKNADIFISTEEVLRKDLEDDDVVVLYNSTCIIRTIKAGIKKSKRDREKEEAEDERRFRGGGRGWSSRGRGEDRGVRRGGFESGGRDRTEKENRVRGIKRERSISSSPGRDARRQIRSDEPDSRRGGKDRRDVHVHDSRRERDRYGSGREGDRRRSRESFDDNRHESVNRVGDPSRGRSFKDDNKSGETSRDVNDRN